MKRYPKSPRADDAKSELKTIAKLPKSGCTSSKRDRQARRRRPPWRPAAVGSGAVVDGEMMAARAGAGLSDKMGVLGA